MTSERHIISTSNAPAAVGPYSQGARAGNLLFTAGQIPLDPATGAMVEGDIEVQTRRVLDNLKGVVEAGGSSLDKVVKVTVFMVNLGDFARMNEIYGEYFHTDPPARSAFQVAALPLGATVEMEAVALVD